jgi:hypothetical protein
MYWMINGWIKWAINCRCKKLQSLKRICLKINQSRSGTIKIQCSQANKFKTKEIIMN